MNKYLSLIFLFLSVFNFAQINENSILGKWIATDKSFAVNVYKVGNDFQAKVIWFDEKLGSGTPMNSRIDSGNPNKNLRHRKIIGMDVLENLTYNAGKKRWEHGKIYDASSGRTWDSYAEIKEDGLLYVRGYWKFTWIGKALHFKRF